jgi:hypothetical protein
MQNFGEFTNYILSNSNHNIDSTNKDVHIILNYPKLSWGDKAQYMTTLTWFSSMGWSKGGSKGMNVIFAETLDEAMQQSDCYDYALISYIGTFYNNFQQNAPLTIHDYFEKFKASGLPCRGHILWKPQTQYPRLHLQSMFLDIQHWRKIGKPSFGHYTGEVELPTRSYSNVHDDYTPHWLKGSCEKVNIQNKEMGEYISKVLEDNKEIINFDLERNTKFFCYPERDYCEALEYERNRNSDIIYTRNNERLKPNITTRKYDVIYSPAGGQLSEFLLKYYGHENTELVIFDYHMKSLNWKQLCYQRVNIPSDIDRVARSFGSNIDNCDYKPDLVEENEALFSMDEWVETLWKFKNVRFLHHDMIKDDVLRVDPNKTNLIYLSNIFSYNFVIHLAKINDIHSKFQQYLQLPNTTVVGKNIFKDSIYHENHSS